MSRKNNNEIKKTKDNILEKGLSLFEAKGYNATGIQEIADAAEIPKGSFYNYFSSKEDFGVAVINFYTEKHLLEWTTRINSNSQDNEKLIQVFLDITKDYDCSESQKGCLLGNLAAEISAASDKCRNALAVAIKSFKEVLIERIITGQANGEFTNAIAPERIADLIWNTWQGSLLELKVKKSIEPLQNNLQTLFNCLS